MGQRGRENLTFLALGVLCCALTFGAALGGEFVWDDVHIVRDNPSLRDWAGLVRNFSTDTWSAAGRAAGQFYRPLMMLTFWLQRQMGAEAVGSYRVLSVVLHLGCGLLLLRLLRRFEVAPVIAVPAALLFMAHPLSTEPAMLLAARNDTLGSLFSLLAISSWPGPEQRNPGRWRALASACSVCAFFSKEAFVIVPVLIGLAQLAAHGRSLGLRHIAWLGAPCLAVAAAIVVRRSLGVASGSDELQRGFLVLAQTGASVVAYYSSLIGTLSNGLTFAKYVPLDPLRSTIVVLLLILLIAAPLGAFLRRGNRPLGGMWFGLTWYALALAPLVLVVPTLGFYQNRYAYFPMMGLILAVSSGLELTREAVGRVAGGGPLRGALWAGVGLLTLVALATTRLEASAWHDNLSLYGADVERDPTNGVSLYHLGHAVYERRGCAEAVPLYAQAARYAPHYARAWKNWSGCLVTLGRLSEALVPAERAVALRPDDAGAQFNLAAALLATGRRQSGVEALERTLTLDPGHGQARRILADVQAQAPSGARDLTPNSAQNLR
jgi:tetratricopeptide (TPR) repeat protein